MQVLQHNETKVEIFEFIRQRNQEKIKNLQYR